MRKVSFIILIFLVGCSHNSEKLIGKWRFMDFYNFQSTDTAKQNEARYFWKHYTISFNSNKKYESQGIFPDSGKWDFSEKTGSINLTYSSGTKESLKVIKLGKKKLIITFPDNNGLIFEKIKPN
jgi:hypothetical protein